MWTALKQDAVTRITILVTAAMTFPYLVPILSPAQLAAFAECYQLFILISLVVLALTFSVRQSEPAEEKRFWAYFTVAFLFLLISELYYNLPLQVRFTPSGRLAMDGFYLMFYLAAVLAIESRPHLRRQAETDPVREFELVGVVVFVFGLLTYFVLIPSSVNRNSYDSYVPSMYLYLALDAFLAARFVVLRRAADSGRWRILYTSLALTATSLFATDLLDCLHYARVLQFRSGTFPDLFWFLPFLMMVVTARLRNVLSPAAQGTRRASLLLTRPRVFGPLTCYAFAVPLIHFGFYAFGLLDASSRSARELLVLVMLLVLVLMALGQQRFLGKKNQSLQSELWRMAAIVESSDDAILSADSEDSIVTWNSGAVSVYGYFSDEIKGKPLTLLFPSDRAYEARQILERVRDGEHVHHHETQHVRKDGACIDVSWTLSAIRDSGGGITGVSAIARDITAQRFALVREEREKTARTLLQVLLQEVHNPLTDILGNLSLLKGEAIPPAGRGCLDEMQASAERIRAVLGRLRNPDLSEANPGSGV